MISLVFRCLCDPELTAVQIEALQRDIWRKCSKRGLGGFFVRDGAALLGHFEGAEKAAFGCVETMIRKPAVTSIIVVAEVEVDARGPGLWSQKLYRREDLPRVVIEALPALALADTLPVEPAKQETASAEV